MDNFIKSSVQSIGNIDDILSTVADKHLSRRTKNLISDKFNELVRTIDQELKQDDELNSQINDLVEMRKIFRHPKSRSSC